MITSDKEVRLRALEPEDLELLYHIENDRQLWDVGTTNVPYSRYVLHDYIANASGNIYNDGEVRLIIENGVLSELSTSQTSTQKTNVLRLVLL